jgi:hypothetical protein
MPIRAGNIPASKNQKISMKGIETFNSESHSMPDAVRNNQKAPMKGIETTHPQPSPNGEGVRTYIKQTST